MPFDVQGARRAGYSDAEIADYLASQSGFNIAAARKSGYNDADIITHISDAQGQKDREKGVIAKVGDAIAESFTAKIPGYGVNALLNRGVNTLRENAKGAFQSDAAKDEGFLDRAGSLLERGTANVVQGGFSALGAATGSRVARDEAANLGKTTTSKIAGETKWEDVKKDPLHNIGSYAVDASLESLPGMALAAVPVVGIPAYAVTNAGNIADQRAQANGQENASFSDLLVSAPAAVASAYLEHIGPRIAATIPGKNALTGIGKAAAGEAATEFAQSVAEYTGGAIGTDKGWSAGEALDQGLAGAVAGAGMGGAIRATGESGKAVMRLSDRYAGRFRPVAPGVRATSVAEASVLTPEDQASPIPNDLIARGKIDVADATAKNGADAILAAAGMPSTGKRVQIAMPDGTTYTGTVRDAFDTDAGDLGRASGIAVDLDNGTVFTEHFDTLKDAGVSITPHDDQAAKGGKAVPVDDGAALAQSIFGDKARITSGYRSAEHPLSRANPNSWHTKSHAAVDMAPIPGMTFDEAKAAIEDKGYTLIEALNETGKGRSAWATGDHWHFVIGKGGTQAAQTTGQTTPAPSVMPAPAQQQAQAEPATPATFGQMVGEAIDNEWSRFSDTSGTLGVPRADMPQIKAEHRGAMVNFLNARGIEHQEETVPADSLKPTQAEFSNQKVLKARDFEGGDRAILTSSDGYVLDGHHQWMGALSKGEDVRTIRLDAPIATLLKVVPEMPSVTTAEGSTDTKPVEIKPALEQKEPPAQPVSNPDALPNGSTVPNAGAAAPAAKVEPLTDKSVIVRGLDNSEASKAIIARGLPAKGIPLWNAKEGGWVVSKKHEAKMRDVIAALTSESITQKPQETAQNEGKTGAESNTPSPAENAKNVQAQIDADFAANREAMGKFNPGDKVEWDHANFYRDGRSRTFTGTVDKVQSAEQGTIRVISDTGGDVTAGARTLRHAANQEPAPQKTATPAAEPAPESKADQKGYGTQNKLFTADAAEKARALLRAKMNQLNAGFDPEIAQAGLTLMGYHIEAGARSFMDAARAVASDLGMTPTDLRNSLRSWYSSARMWMEDNGHDIRGMDDDAAVRVDLSRIDQWGATQAAEPAIPQAEEPTNGTNAEPDSTQGNDRAGDGASRSAGVSASQGERKSAENPERSGNGGDGNVRADRNVVRRDSGQADVGQRSVDSGEPRKAAGRRGRAQPGDRVSKDPKPERADGGRNYLAPVGSIKREGGWKTTAARNLDIVELVNRLDAEQRQATPEEQALLAKFTGWGAGEIRNNLFRTVTRNPDGSRKISPPTYGEWKELGQRASRLLTGDALETALQSTQYAHYTSEAVIRSIWSGLRRLGFNGGKIVEPGMGTGLFAVAGPSDVMGNSNYTGIELDGFTAKVASYLLPQETIIPGDYTKTKLPDGFFDIAIGNPPFADIKVTDDPAYRKQRFSLHDYFFAKTIDKVRPGGLLVFVTSRYTMDKLDPKARQYIAERADLIGAIRLPQTAFKENAGTEVVTDVLFLQRRAPGAERGGADWLASEPISVGGEQIPINSYYAAHPEMVLGQHSTTGSMYRAKEYTVVPGEQNIEQAFAHAIETLPENIYQSAAPKAASDAVAKTVEADMRPSAEKEGAVYVKDGALFRREDGVGRPLSDLGEKLTAKDLEWIKDYVPLRDAVKQAQRDQLQDGNWEKSLAALNKVYDSFIKKHGEISAFSESERTFTDDDGNETTVTYRRLKNRKRLDADIESTLVEALEKIGDDGKISKSPFLLGRTLKKPTRPEIKSATDAVAVTLDEIGRFDPAYVAGLLGKSEKEVLAELGDEVFQHPDGSWLMADEYLSGDVVAKLDEAQIAAQADPRFERNVEALVKVQPRPLAHSDIAVKLGAGWIEADVVQAFSREVLGEEMAGIRYEPATGSWIVPDSSKRWGRTATSEWATEDRSARELLDAVLNNRTIKVTRQDENKKTFTDQEATALANERAKKMADKFKSWVWTDGDRASRLADKYNRLFNNLAPRKFDGKHLTFPGLSTRYNLYDHQRRAIWRVIATGNTYLNHAVGAGKTLEMIVAGMEQRRLGLIRKPMYVVPNHMLNQFAREFLDAYPAANIMVADENAFHTSNRRRFMAQAALNDPDAVIVSHSSFGKIGTSAETRARVVDRFISELEMVMDELKGQENRIARSKLEKQIEQMKRRFEGKAGAEGKDKALTFEEMGIDFLFVDEAHEFRKLDFATNRTAVKGIDANGSQRALDLYIKLLWLNEQRPGRAAVLASGTPVTNTMAEIYTVMRYMDQAGLERDGLQAFDAWASMFGEVVSGFEQNAAGGYEMVERFSKFVNVPEMMKRVRSFMDVLTSEQLGDLVKRPALKGGLPENVIAEASDDLNDYMKVTLQERIEKSRKWKPSKDQPGNPDPIINIITDGRLSAIDMRFVDPTLPNDPSSKLNKMIDRIIEKHREFSGIVYTDPATGKPMARKGATQIVFSAVGFGDMVAKSRGFDARAWVDKRLAEAGISRDAVAWMNDQNTHAKKEATFKDMRNAVKRVLLGSPKNMGTGVNVQARLKALHYLSPPWYPSDVEQPHGRIIRQGNMNPEAEIYWYATKGTYDSTAWNMVSRKQRFIEQAMRGDDSIRSLEDISEANQYEMASALAAGDERVIQLAGLSNEIERLTKLEAAHAEEQVSLKWRKEALERMVEQKGGASSRLAAAIEARGPYAPFSVTVDGVRYQKPGEAGAAMAAQIETAMAKYKIGDPDMRAEIGRYQGNLPVLALITTQNVDGKPRKTFDVAVEAGPVELTIIDTRTSVENLDPAGLSQRIGNALGRLESDKARAERDIEDAKVELAQARRKIGAPFEYAAELGEKVAERARLQGELASETAASQAARDAAAPKASIPDDQPVADLTGSELGPVRDILDMGRKARAWFKAHLRAKTITSSDGVKVSFGRVGESKINGGDRIFSAVPAIADIISKGEHAGPIAPSEKWAERGVTGTHTYTAPVKIGDEVRRYGVMVHEMADGRRFYYLTDNPGDYVGGQPIKAEGRKYALPEVEVTADNLNLFSVDDEINVDFLPLEEIPDEWAARLAARDAQDMEMGVDARAERARYKATIDQLGSRMDRLGLTERVTLMVKGKLLRMENAAGTYRNGIIEVALSSKQSPLDTINHEAIHALRDLGLIYDGEWAALARAARADTAMMSSIRRRYAHLNLSEDGLVEEAIADRFKNWAANPQAETGIINRTFKRLRDFIEALGNVLRGNGFNTAEDVMRAIDAGKMGGRDIGAGGRGNYRASIPESPEFDSAETERRFQEAKAGVGTPQSLIDRFKETAEHTWHGLTRHWIALPNEPKYSALQQKLRAIESAPQHARERTVAMLEDMVKDFSKEDLDLFTRKVILDDLAWDAANERDLPFGFTPGSLTEEKAKIDRILMADPEQRIWKAAMKRKLANRQIAQELVAAGVLEAEQIKNPAYYRHQVLEYARAQANYARTPGQKLKTPKWAKRMGSTLDINANLLEAEFDWLNRAFVDIPVAQTIEWIKNSPHNILEDLRRQAKDSNKDGVAAKLHEAQDTIDDQQSTDDERAQAAVLIDTEKGFRQSIAMGFDIVRQHLKDDEINVPARFQSAADAIESGKGTVGDPPFAFLSWMLDTDQPGAMGAAMVMKAIGQRRSWTKNLLGRDYINDQDAGELVKRLAPEGYRTWQPDEGKLLFTVKTLPEHTIDAMIAQLDAPAGIDPTVFRAALEGARSQLAMGGDRYTMILPEEVADTLSNLRRAENDGLFEHLAREPLRAWKRWVLINPRRFFKYNLNNLTGDLDAVLAGNPQLLKQVGRAGRELADVKLGRAKASDRYNEAVARGVFDSGLSVQEIPDINTLAPFERFAKQPGAINKVTMIPLRKAWNALQGATQWRENVFRYAAYLDYVERLERGDSQSSVGYGASRPNMVDAVPDMKDRAAMLARDLLGDYGAISHYGSWLRETIIPFWSWTEINTRRYWRLSTNAYSQGIGKGLAVGGGMALASGARTTAWLAIRMAAMYGLFSLWNALFFGDEEDELDDNQKRQMHVILGRNANGDIITLRTQGALSDMLGWFGMADIAKLYKDYELGRTDFTEIPKGIFKSAVNKLASSVSPVISVPIEASTGKKLWPDVFNPRPINDRWRNFLSSFSLENEYDMAMDKPSRGYGRSWQEAFIYRRDPGEIAYNEARGIAYDWLKREKGQEFDGGFTSKRSEATRDYRTALRYGDREAADKALRKMIELGVDARDFQEMVKRAAPLGPISKKDQQAFVSSLTKDEYDTFVRAQRWYEETFLMPRGGG